MKLKFKILDDFESLVPRYSRLEKEAYYQRFIANKFEETLCFALIESTNVLNLTEIGEVEIYSPKNKAEDLKKAYYSIIKKAQNKYPDYVISNYNEWYCEKAYILIVNNKEGKIEKSKRQWSKFKNSEGACDAGDLKDSLHSYQIEQYLNYYADLMHNDFGLSQYPFYCIIIRPISIKSGTEAIPLGNLYLHFATDTEMDEKFYRQFVVEFVSLWLHQNSIHIYTHTREFKFKKDFEKKDFYPNLKRQLTGQINTDRKHTLKDYYDLLFESKSKDKFDKELEYVYETSFEIFLKENFTHKLFREIYGGGKSALRNYPNDLSKFRIILLQREVFKLGLLLFNKTPQELHYLMARREGKGSTGDDAYQTVFIYFSQDRFLPISHKPDQEVTIEKIITSLSIEEKKWLVNLESFIRNFNNDDLKIAYKKLIEKIDESLNLPDIS